MKFTEADRDIFDWSGKKPLDYQKQLTSISASTFSSEYKALNNVVIYKQALTMPTRQNTAKKNRNQGVQRSMTIMSDCSAATLQRSYADNFDTKSIVSEVGSDFNKRKDKRFRASFLKRSMLRKNQ